jgi:hypothetical protein
VEGNTFADAERDAAYKALQDEWAARLVRAFFAHMIVRG